MYRYVTTTKRLIAADPETSQEVDELANAIEEFRDYVPPRSLKDKVLEMTVQILRAEASEWRTLEDE